MLFLVKHYVLNAYLTFYNPVDLMHYPVVWDLFSNKWDLTIKSTAAF